MSVDARSVEKSTLSTGVRTAINLALVIHGFMISVAFFTVFEPTPLQTRLLGVLSAYLQMFNYDLDYAPYYLTIDDLIATPEGFQRFAEREYFVEALPKGAEPTQADAWFRVAGGAWGWTEASRRHQRVGVSARNGEREEWQAELVIALARQARSESGDEIARIRVRQHLPVPHEYFLSGMEFDPQGEAWFRTVYEAIVVRDKILPVVDDRETANAVGSGAAPSPNSPSVPSNLPPEQSNSPMNSGTQSSTTPLIE